MNPIALLRPPLVFLVMAEAALVAILGGVTWHVWQDRFAPGPAAVATLPAAPPPAATSRRAGLPASPSPPPSTPTPTPRPGPTPGLPRTNADFLTREMAELNRVERTFEDLEWRATKAVVDGIQRYIEGVVLPAIERSESRR
jgi:hypothetical protein